jgi:hypothetical protein
MSDSAFFSHCSRVDGELLMLKVGIFISQKAPCRALADPSLTRRPDQRELALRLELGLPLIASTNWKIACGSVAVNTSLRRVARTACGTALLPI